MSQQLTNRQSIHDQLNQFIQDMTVSESSITGIMKSPVTEPEFVTNLETLNHKTSFVKEQSFKETQVCSDVRDIMERLQIEAITKIRAYLLEQIHKFRKPMTNSQVPRNNMLEQKLFFEFILSNGKHVAEEICSEYIDTMSKIYYSYFKSYSSRLKKLQFDENPTRDDLMGVKDTVCRGLSHKSHLKHRGTVFSIGSRGEVLTSHLEAPMIVP